MATRSFALFLVLASSVASAARRDHTRTQPSSALLTAVQEELRKAGFIRNLDCRTFANLMLTRVGLPLLGQDSPVQGVRGDLNRAGESEALPVLEDGTRRSEHPLLEYHIKASRPEASGIWYFELDRKSSDSKGAPADTRSRFEFRVGAVANRPSCDLEQIRFLVAPSTSPVAFDAERCLSLFDPAVPPSRDQGFARSAMEQDCALGFRYFIPLKWRR